MNSLYMKRITESGIILAFVLVSACDKINNHEAGFLAGTISIGPICPVERIPPDPACLPTAETYKAYPVVVYTSDRKTRIKQLNPSLNGHFSSELSQGKYLVVLETAQKNIGGSNLPVEIAITSSDTTKLNISIDTGIR
jgi:hypothetical protein